MRQQRVKLEIWDALIHYSLALYLGLPVVILVGYFSLAQFGLFGIARRIDEMIIIMPALTLGPLSLIAYLVQREKLKFKFIRLAVNKEEFRALVKEISEELRWTIRSNKGNTFVIKTNPGFVNQSWGQHVTLRLVKDGILVNSISDPNKGSWIATFGSNSRNVDDIKRRIMDRTKMARPRSMSN